MQTQAERSVQTEYPPAAGNLASVATWNGDLDSLREVSRTQEHKAAELTTTMLRDELLAENTFEARNVVDLLAAAPVEASVTVGDQRFHLSGVISMSGRRRCIGYVRQEDGKIAPRLFYRSLSEGDWRVAPWTAPVDTESRRRWYYSKGDKYEGGYVRETRLVDALREELHKNEQRNVTIWHPETVHWLNEHFTDENLGTRGEDHYWETADHVRVEGMPQEAFRFWPGKSFQTEPNERSARDQLAALRLPEHLAPNFENAWSTGQFMHPRLGQVNQISVRTRQGNLVWHFCYDTQGRVWPAGLTRMNDTPNSYGTSSEVTFAGVFDNKPLEHRSQITGLVEGRDCSALDDRYADITPLLGNLPMVRDFKRHFGIGIENAPTRKMTPVRPAAVAYAGAVATISR